MALPRTLIDPKRIYLEAQVRDYGRGREVLARYPDAELIEVASHWTIPELYGDKALAADWLRMKRDVLVLGFRKGLAMRPEELLWRPDLQETKLSQSGMRNLRYRVSWKRRWLAQLLSWREALIPYCQVRYAF